MSDDLFVIGIDSVLSFFICPGGLIHSSSVEFVILSLRSVFMADLRRHYTFVDKNLSVDAAFVSSEAFHFHIQRG